MERAFRQLRAAGLIVALTTALLGWFVLRTWLSPLPATFAPQFGSARWIESRDASPTGYFRSRFFLDEIPRRAWVQIAATDSFDLYVNGKRIAKESFTSACATGLFDIGPNLTQGRNSVAVRVVRLSFPGAAQVCVAGL